MRLVLGIAAACGLSLAVAGCVTTGPTTPVASAPNLAPRVIPAGADARPIQFRRIVVKMSRGARIGSIQGGYLCVPAGDLTCATGWPMMT